MWLSFILHHLSHKRPVRVLTGSESVLYLSLDNIDLLDNYFVCCLVISREARIAYTLFLMRKL